MRRVDYASHQRNTELARYDSCVGERATNLSNSSACNVEERCPDWCRGMGNEHIARLEAVEVIRSGDNTRGAMRAAWAARRAQEDMSPIPFLHACRCRHCHHPITAPDGIGERWDGWR